MTDIPSFKLQSHTKILNRCSEHPPTMNYNGRKETISEYHLLLLKLEWHQKIKRTAFPKSKRKGTFDWCTLRNESSTLPSLPTLLRIPKKIPPIFIHPRQNARTQINKTHSHIYTESQNQNNI